MKRVLAVVLLSAAPLVLAQPGATKDLDQKAMPMKNDQARVHKGSGVVKSVDVKKGTVTLAHEPIQSMNWPSMTMSFKAQEVKMIEGLLPGKKVDFEFVQQGKDHVITSVK